MSEKKWKHKYVTEAVSAAARGRWLTIFCAVAPALTEAVQELQKGKRFAHVTDPVHGSKRSLGDGFRLLEDANETGSGFSNKDGFIHGGFKMIMWINNWSFGKTINEVGDYLMLDPADYRSSAQTRQPVYVHTPRELTEEEIAEIKKITAKNKALFNESVPLSRAPKFIWKYLMSRGISLRASVFEGTVRYHPSIPYWIESDTELDSRGKAKLICLGNYPGFLAALTSEDEEYFNLHRTYLTPLGEKADVPKNKKIAFTGKRSVMPKDAFIRLGGKPTNGILGISEGIENALSGIRAYNIPVWAAYSSGVLKSRDVPSNVHTVIIFADKDRPDDLGNKAGEDAADDLRNKLEKEGKTVIILLPKYDIPENEKSIDWNDVLVKYGLHAFPSLTTLLNQKAS